MPFYYYFDWSYIVLVLPALILALAAQGKVSSAFNKYSRVPSRVGMTGAEAARRIMELNGIYDVRIERVAGNLTDIFKQFHSRYRSGCPRKRPCHTACQRIRPSCAEKHYGSCGEHRLKTCHAAHTSWNNFQLYICYGKLAHNIWNTALWAFRSVYAYNPSSGVQRVQKSGKMS